MLTLNGVMLKPQLVVLTLLACFVPTPAAIAQSVSEPWRATALSEVWNLEKWSEECGPKPQANRVPAAAVTITRRGGELYFVEPGRQYSTTGCWERYPGLNRAEHGVGNGSWTNVCRTQPKDPRQAVVRTAVTANDDRITWRETGEYRLSIQGAQCFASVTRTRHFTRIESTGSPAATTPSATPAAKLPAKRTAKDATKRCAKPGEPRRLTVSPALLWAPPDGELALHASVYDADGCPVSVPVRWKPPAQAPLSVSAGGLVRVAADAAPGEYPIVVSTASGVRASLRFHVVAPADVDRFLNQQQGEVQSAIHLPSPPGERRSVGAKATEAEDRAVRRKRWFVAIGVGISLLLGALGAVLLRQQRPQPHSGRHPSSPPERMAAVGSRRRCPSCGRVYTNGALYCGVDGQSLQPE